MALLSAGRSQASGVWAPVAGDRAAEVDEFKLLINCGQACDPELDSSNAFGSNSKIDARSIKRLQNVGKREALTGNFLLWRTDI